MLQEKIKSIVSLYIKVPESDISMNTIIDRSAVESSILLHRMYAHLLKEKIIVENYWDIKVFGDLLQNIKGNTEISIPATNKGQKWADYSTKDNDTNASVGIDIEDINQFPLSADYRSDPFYHLNFSTTEIAYCILQPIPPASFAGLFAAKEAIVKADNNYAAMAFNTIVIQHLPNGKPVHPQFQISISHTPALAIGIAVKSSPPSHNNSLSGSPSITKQSNGFFLPKLLSFIAIILSIVAIIICMFK